MRKLPDEGGRNVRVGFQSEEATPSHEAVVRRLDRVRSALNVETWLPTGLRGLLQAETEDLKKKAQLASQDGLEVTAVRVHELALATFRYGPRLLDSEAVTQLRVLDLEMNPSAPKYDGDLPFFQTSDLLELDDDLDAAL